MFIIEPIKQDEATGELKLLYRLVEKKMGMVPPHFELFATIDIEGMKRFLEENLALINHERIEGDLLPYLRLEIAKRECRNYCIDFNTQMLQRMQYPSLDEAQTMMIKTILKAMYESKAFGTADIDKLEEQGFEHDDFFALLRYGTGFMGRSKMIEAYLI